MRRIGLRRGSHRTPWGTFRPDRRVGAVAATTSRGGLDGLDVDRLSVVLSLEEPREPLEKVGLDDLTHVSETALLEHPPEQRPVEQVDVFSVLVEQVVRQL